MAHSSDLLACLGRDLLRVTPAWHTGAARAGTSWVSFTVCLVTLLAGCNPELDHYRRMEIGEPLEDSGGLASATAPAQGEVPLARRSVFFFGLPSIWAIKDMGVVLDPDGRVIAKQYREIAVEHWLVAQLGACRWYMEVQCPPDCFEEVRTGQQESPPHPNAVVEMQSEAERLADGLPKDDQGMTVGLSTLWDECVFTFCIPIHPRRLHSGVLQRITEENPTPRIEAERDLDLAGMDRAKFFAAQAEFGLVQQGERLWLQATIRAPRKARSVTAYLDYLVEKIAEAFPPVPQPPDPPLLATNYVTGMYFGGQMSWPEGFVNQIEDFEGVTREGFDRRIDFRNGGKARIRNLGHRRIRVEFEFLRIIDPFFIIPMAEFSGEQPKPKVKTR